MKIVVTSFISLFAICSCVKQDPEQRKAVPPKSSASKIPWNQMRQGEGTSQFGGMLDRR